MKKATIIIHILFFICSAYAYAELGVVNIHGFLSQGYLATTDDNNFFLSDTKDGTFEFNELGINFTTDPTDNLHLGVQFFAKDLGTVGNDKLTIDWAYADYGFRDWLSLRAGIFKRPHGLCNQSWDIDATRTEIFLPQSIYDEVFRDVQLALKGLGIYGTLPFNIDYQMAYGASTLNSDSGAVMIIENDVPLNGFSTDPCFSSTVFWNTPLENLRIGGSYQTYQTKFDIVSVLSFATVPGFYEIVGDVFLFSVEYMWENLVLTSEYKESTSDLKLTDTIITDPVLIDFLGGTTTFDNVEKAKELGYYFKASYTWSDHFEFCGYYSFRKEEFNGEEGDSETDIALCFRFDINDNWLIKFECHFFDGLFGVDVPEDVTNPSENWMMYATKISYNF